mgnify:CR=1 FL=1
MGQHGAMDDLKLARSIAAGRIVFGALMLFIPNTVLARASAERPSPSNSPISPNTSPCSMSATIDSRPSTDRLAMATRPEATTQSRSGSPPSPRR